MDSCFDLVGSRQHGVASNDHPQNAEVMTSDETQIQIFADWTMSHAKRVTKDNRKNPEYHVVLAVRRLLAAKNCPVENSWPNHVNNCMSSHSLLQL